MNHDHRRPGCGCEGSVNPPSPCASPNSKQMLLVETTQDMPDLTGNPQAVSSGTATCAKQEPSYDFITSGFIAPTTGGVVQVSVCNNAVYTLGQWLQFSSPFITLRVSAKDGNGKNMTLINSCSNGNPVSSNPAAGSVAVPQNSTFSVVGSPNCSSDSEEVELINTAFSEMEELCTPALIETDGGAVVQLTGQTRSNPDDTAFKQCIRRIKNAFFQNGMFKLPGFSTFPSGTDPTNYRDVVIHKTTGQEIAKPHPSETVGLIVNRKYTTAYTTGSEKVMGPVFFPSFFDKNLVDDGDVTVDANYLSILNGTPYTVVYNLNIAEITGLINADMQDFFYLMVKSRFAVRSTANAVRWLKVEMNGVEVGILGQGIYGWREVMNLMSYVKILRSDMNLTIKVTALRQGAGTVNMWFNKKIDLIGACI